MHNPLHTVELICNDTRTPLGRVTLAGYIANSCGVQDEARVLGRYALVYLLSGSGWYRDVQQRVRRVRAGDVLVLFPELGHLYGPSDDEHWTEFYCVFDGPAFNLLRDVGLLGVDRPVIQPASGADWFARMQTTLFGRATETLAERTILMSQFVQLVTELAVANSSALKPTAPDWIVEACRLLREPGPEMNTPAIAARLGVPYETFRKRFQEQMGVAPGHYRLVRRIDAACGLLLETNLTAQAIAEHLGFANPFHFSRRFKDITGLTPRDFRRRMPREPQLR